MPQIYERVRDLILDGHYPPGARLTQLELSEEHKVGRTPLREALRLLEADGLVRSEANRGISVTPVSLAHAEDLYALRLLVEPPLLKAKARSFSEAELDEMRRHITAMEDAERDVKRFQGCHLDLHLVALEHYGTTTRDTVLDLYRRIQRIQRVYMARPSVPVDVVDIDRRIIDALGDGDGDRAKQLMELHLLDWAIGLIIDVEPDHEFGILLAAAEGIGITIDIAPGTPAKPPVTVRWDHPATDDLPQTANVSPTVAPRRRSRRSSG